MTNAAIREGRRPRRITWYSIFSAKVFSVSFYKINVNSEKLRSSDSFRVIFSRFIITITISTNVVGGWTTLVFTNISEKVSSDIWFAELKTVILPSYYPKRVISNNNCRKLFLELVSLYFSKIVMLQRLKIVIISPFSDEYIFFSRKLKWL